MLTVADIKSKSPQELHGILSDLSLEKKQLKEKMLAQSLEKDSIIKEKDKELMQEKEKLISEITQLRHQVNKLLRQQFGRKSEKYASSGQGNLFNETDLPSTEETLIIEQADKEIHITSHTRKSKQGRKKLPDHLPRIECTHDLADDEKLCVCGCTLTQIGDERSEQLEFIPAQVRVIEHIRLKYACRGCEENIKLAPYERPHALPKSIATPGLLSHVLVSKFNDHLPFYRQERILQRMGIDIARRTLCTWAMKCGTLLAPLITLMQAQMCAYDIGYADETTVQVLKEKERSAQTKSYIWCFRGGPPDKRSVIYQYRPSRGHEVPERFWKGFKGYLHSDGFSGYQTLYAKAPIVGVHCWAHARRRFVDITKATQQEGLAHHAVKQIARLYTFEKEFKEKGFTAEQIYTQRQKNAVPLLNAFKDWCTSHLNTVPPKSPIGDALQYCLKFWDGLMRYSEDGRLEIDNNGTERAIRPFTIGRKNWIFFDRPEGADAGAIIYSLIETCKAHHVEPYAYLKYVLGEIVLCKTEEDFEKLLPFNVDTHVLLKQYR